MKKVCERRSSSMIVVVSFSEMLRPVTISLVCISYSQIQTFHGSQITIFFQSFKRCLFHQSINHFCNDSDD